MKKRVVAFSSSSPAVVIVRAVLIGALAGAVLCALLLLVCAWAITAMGKIPQDFLQPLILAVSGISSLIAGMFAAKIGKKRGLILGAGSGLMLFILCLLAGMLQGQELHAAAVITRLAVMMLAGALGGFLMAGRQTKIR